MRPNPDGAILPSPLRLALTAAIALAWPAITLSQTASPSTPPRAVGQVEATDDPAGPIILHADSSTGENLLYKWVQTRGPKVVVEDPAAPSIRFTRPDPAEPIDFLLVVGNAAGVDSTLVPVPPATPEPLEPPSVPPPDENSPRADAGDPQVGLVGHRITLNGMRSQPRAQLAYRWLQVSGPPIQSPVQDGYIFSFIPTQAGTYRFALVVAAAGQISDPSTVDVIIGLPEPRAAAPVPVVPQSTTPSTSLFPPPLWQLCRNTLQSIDGGPQRGEALAAAFDSVADRIELYSTFGDLFREVSLRLASIVPEDPARRNAWIQQLFTPLTSRLIERLRETGLDLARPEAQNQPLTGVQKTALAELYRSAAHGFRAAARTADPNSNPIQPAVFTTSPGPDRQGVTRR
jgi:hypothetical protein